MDLDFGGVTDPSGNLYLTDCVSSGTPGVRYTMCDLVSLGPDGSMRVREKLSVTSRSSVVAWTAEGLLIRSGQELVVVDAANGKPRWTFLNVRSAAVDQHSHRLYFESSVGLVVVDLLTGAAESRPADLGPLVLDEQGNLYRYEWGSPRDRLLSLDSDLNVRWQVEVDRGPGAPSVLAVSGGEVLAGAGQTYDARTGALLASRAPEPDRLWNSRVAFSPRTIDARDPLRQITSSFLTSSDTLLMTHQRYPSHEYWETQPAKPLHCVAEWDATGTRVTGRRIRTGEPSAIVGGRLIVREGRSLSAYELPGAKALGSEGWVTPRGDAHGSGAPARW